MNPSIPSDPVNNDLFGNLVTLAQPRASSAYRRARALRRHRRRPSRPSAPRYQAMRNYPAQRTAHRARRIPPPQRNLHGRRQRRHDARPVALHDRRRGNGLGRLLRSRQRRRPRILLVDHAEAHRHLLLARPASSPMFSYERSVAYPEGHRNVIFAQRGIRTLPRLPMIASRTTDVHAPDTQMLYAYLQAVQRHRGVAHQRHQHGHRLARQRSGRRAGRSRSIRATARTTKWPDAPRSNSEKDSIGGWRPKGFVDLALEKGYKLAFEASSDHISTHMSYANIYVTDGDSRGGAGRLQEAPRLRRDRQHPGRRPQRRAHDGRRVFRRRRRRIAEGQAGRNRAVRQGHVIKDNKYVYSIEPKAAEVDFTWRDMRGAKPARPSYYYVRGEQADGEIVWVSPMWITYTGK